MTRKAAGRRALIGVPYMLAYVFVLFPIAFVVGIVLGAADLLWRGATGASDTLFSRIVLRVWDWVGGNARWTLTGRGEFRWLP